MLCHSWRFPNQLRSSDAQKIFPEVSEQKKNIPKQTTFKYLIVDGKLTPRLKSLHELLDEDIIEVESNFMTVEEIMSLLERYTELRDELQKYMEHIDDFTAEQRGEMARVLAETDYFKKDCTLRDLIQIVTRLDQNAEHYSQ